MCLVNGRAYRDGKKLVCSTLPGWPFLCTVLCSPCMYHVLPRRSQEAKVVNIPGSNLFSYMSGKLKNVFISYSWDSKEHKSWVLKLSNDLKSNGVKVFIDHNDVKIGYDIGHSIETAIKKADFVLVILTLRYKDKAEGRTNWVGRENNLYTILELIEQRQIVLPVLRHGSDKTSIPFNLRSKSWISMTDRDNYEERFKQLLSRIYPQLTKETPTAPLPESLDEVEFNTTNYLRQPTVYKDINLLRSPVIVFHGFEDYGKTTALLRLSRFLKSEFTPSPDRTFSNCKHYLRHAISFQEGLDRRLTHMTPGIPLLVNLYRQKREQYHLFDVPWSHTCQLVQNDQTPQYLHQLFSSDLTRINLIFFDYSVSVNNQVYTETIIEFMLKYFTNGKDKVILVVSKADTSNHLLANRHPIVPRFQRDFKNNSSNNIFLKELNSLGIKTPRIVPYSSFDENNSTDKVLAESLDYYPKSLWRVIERELVKVKKSWFS